MTLAFLYRLGTIGVLYISRSRKVFLEAENVKKGEEKTLKWWRGWQKEGGYTIRRELKLCGGTVDSR